MHKLSCGCTVESILDQYPITLGNLYQDNEGYKPVLEYYVYCKDCYNKAFYEEGTVVLTSAEDEENFLLYPELFYREVLE